MDWSTSTRCGVSGIDAASEVPYLLDTNVVIDFLRGALEMDDLVGQFVKGTQRPLVSLISKIELLGYPQISPREETKIRHWLTQFEVVGLDDRIAERAIGLKRSCRLRTPDAIIAATALARGVCLVTRDKVLTAKIPGLKVFSPPLRS